MKRGRKKRFKERMPVEYIPMIREELEVIQYKLIRIANTNTLELGLANPITKKVNNLIRKVGEVHGEY